MNDIAHAINNLFKKHRIVFWYDKKEELRQEYEALSLPGVEKIELKNNEYGVKYRILREEPEQKFLLYHEGEEPKELENWLLDIQLAQGIFSADQVSLWTTELGLGSEFWNLVQEHAEFFKAASRRDKLRAKLNPNDSEPSVRIKMLAICAGSDTESRIEGILESLLNELAAERSEKFDLVKRCNLNNFLWKELEDRFGYISASPSIADFAIALFKASYTLSLEENATLNQDALVFLKRWKNDRRYTQAFETLSEQCADNLGIEKDLQKRDIKNLLEIDYFKLIDQKILNTLVQEIMQGTISAGESASTIWRRRNTHWFNVFRDVYESLYHASQFKSALDKADLQMKTLREGVLKYENTWYRLDQHYRKFIYHFRASKHITLLEGLNEQVENLYSNNYLLLVNDNWQKIIDNTETWDATPIIRQNNFFEHFIAEYLKSKNKVAVIISDALRYEIGEELSRTIEAEDRYTTELIPMLSVLPSYTQLGMAALLPHQNLSIIKNGMVEVDGQSASGTENRAKILASAVLGGATAIRSADLLNMSRNESRELTKNNQIIYIYHNQIDAVGDKRETEGRVFEAVEDGMEELVEILKKLTNANLSNIIITADHGFIYQNRPLDDSEFANDNIQGEHIFIRNRRFVVGKDLDSSGSFKEFSPTNLNQAGDYQVFIPKSINRLRLQGAGSRFVHGGAALEEVVIPVIKINKKRSGDIAQVEVEN
ncbi:MAG: BREX-1 system phosphatase PglZ type A, partial [Chloroflexi bacterium]